MKLKEALSLAIEKYQYDSTRCIHVKGHRGFISVKEYRLLQEKVKNEKDCEKSLSN